MSGQIDKLLKNHSLRTTKVRRKVLDVFLRHEEALAQSDLEEEFDQIDRITLYRTLRTFEEKGLIHRAIDGSDKTRFAICHSNCTEEAHHDNHAHFHCNVCGKTICLDSVAPPAIPALPGFQVTATYLVIQGLCENCR